ncbi:DUF4913 domain-containing protein [Thalassiella azotivora]
MSEVFASDVDEWADDEQTTQADEPEPAQLYYPNVEVFVTEQLAPMYRRHLDGRNRTWCPQWWRHAEAIARLEALWRAWEHLRHDPALGISIWFRDHADHHMTVLLDPDGPFKGCSHEKGHASRSEPLPLEHPPPGLFARVSAAAVSPRSST